MSIVGLVLHGLGIAAQLVASFTDALRTAIAHGFPNNLETYGLISGLWTSTFALGAFIGPSVGGILYDCVGGFRNGSMFVVALNALVVSPFYRNNYQVIFSDVYLDLGDVESGRHEL